jgi:hypothetical protein
MTGTPRHVWDDLRREVWRRIDAGLLPRPARVVEREPSPAPAARPASNRTHGSNLRAPEPPPAAPFDLTETVKLKTVRTASNPRAPDVREPDVETLFTVNNVRPAPDVEKFAGAARLPPPGSPR